MKRQERNHPSCRIAKATGSSTPRPGSPESTPEKKPDYDLHIKVPAEMRSVLRDSAELAYSMGDIPKPDLIDLMNLFIGWGVAVQKNKWLYRVGYR